MVRNPTSCSSILELGGIIPPSNPSPHWPSWLPSHLLGPRYGWSPLVLLVVIIHGG